MKICDVIDYIRNYQSAYERERGWKNVAIHALHSEPTIKLWVIEKSTEMSGLALLYRYNQKDPKSWNFVIPTEEQINYLAAWLPVTYNIVDRANKERNKALYQRLAEVSIKL